MVLKPEERDRLNAFRRLAREVRQATIIDHGEEIQISTHPSEDGANIDVWLRLLDRERFRSLALAVRQAYQQGDDAHFFSVCGILHRHGNQPLRDRVGELHQQFSGALRDPANEVRTEDGQTFTAEQVLETWMYGVAFHQDSDRQNTVRALEQEGVSFAWSVQDTVLQLAGRILDLDDVIADFLDEPQVSRI